MGGAAERGELEVIGRGGRQRHRARLRDVRRERLRRRDHRHSRRGQPNDGRSWPVTTYREIETEVFDTLDAFARGVADWLLAQANAKQGRFAVALSGGETPPPIYAPLATAPYRDKFPWSRTHCYWGD